MVARGADQRPHLSSSSLRRWLECPHAWYLRYVVGIVPPPSHAQAVGTAVHEYLERIVSVACDMGVEWRRDEWAHRASSVQIPSDPDAAALAAALRDHAAAEWDQPLAAEAQSEAQCEGYIVIGYVDAITRHNGADRIVRELKTSLSPRPPRWEHYDVQVATYAWLTGLPRVAITHVSPAGVREWATTIQADAIDRVRRLYDEAWAGITAGGYWQAVGPRCRWCDMRQHCDAGRRHG